MTKARHVFNRTNVCYGLCAVALFGLSLGAHASTYPNATRANGQSVWNQATNGKSTTVNGQGVGTGSAPSKATANADVLDASGNVIVSGGATVNVNGSGVPVSVNGKISKGDIANAAVAAAGCAVGGGGVAGAVVCGGVALALPITMNWLANAGVRINPTTKALEVADPQACTVGPCFLWWAHEQQVRGTTLADGCSKYGQFLVSLGYTVTSAVPQGLDQCFVVYGEPGREPNQTNTVHVFSAERPVDPEAWTGGSIADATGLMNNSRIPSADIVGELEGAGQTDGLPIKDIEISGPSSVQGPSVTNVTNNSTTNTTTNVTTTTNNYTYNTNTVTNNSSSRVTTTTTAVKNPDGTTTTTTGPTTTETMTPGEEEPAKPEDPPVQCDKYPDSLGCAQLDTPTAEIPRETKTITFEAEDMLGGGQCPADVMTTLNTLGGRSVKVVDWQTFCGMAVPLRALVMGLAAIMAFFIIMPGGVRE